MVNLSEDYLRSLGSGPLELPLAYQVLLAKGQAFPHRTVQSLTYGTLGECYRNAWRLAWEEDLYYVEGYAISGAMGFPLEHAWCVDAEGRVFDNTWRAGSHYFGMAFDESSLDALHEITGYHCILGNLWRLSSQGVPEVRQLLLDAALPIDVNLAPPDGND